jgi:succinate dehydrogenase / fumarate reductase, cytochrome b subunit
MSKPRPLSPHLQVYKIQLTSLTSIAHRVSGLFLYIGALLLSWLIIIAVFSNMAAESYLFDIFQNIFVQLALFFWTLALFYHLLNGVRHLFWDIGKGLEIKTAKTNGLIVILLSVILTASSWYYAFSL